MVNVNNSLAHSEHYDSVSESPQLVLVLALVLSWIIIPWFLTGGL